MVKTISIKNLKKHFGKVKAVNGASFNVAKGEIFGFLGPNGAGKTTTIRCMMDFIRPDSGSIKILGLDSDKDSVELKSKIGYLAADPRLYENWTGTDHIRFVRNIRRSDGNVSEFIRKLNFDPKIRVKNLSTGNRQKLSLILALMANPEVLILDEPTSGLDPILQNAIYKILAEFSRRKKTVIMSSHNLPEVERVCKKVAIIKEGKVVEVGDISSLKSKRLHKVSVQFEDKYKVSDFKSKEVEVIDQFDSSLVLSVKDDINPLILKLAKYRIKDLEIERAGLEEIFLEFYE